MLSLTSLLPAAFPPLMLAAEGGGSPLDIEWNLFIWTIVTFVVLMAVLAKLGWKPLMTALAKREQAIRDAVDGAQKVKEEAEKLAAQYQLQLQSARTEAKAIVDEGRRDSEALRAEILEKARRESQESLDRAKRELELAKDKALGELREQAADLSIQIASKIMRKKLDATENRRLVQEALQEAESSPKSKLLNERSKRNMQNPVARVYSQALFELAMEKQTLDAVASEFEAFRKAYDATPELRLLLGSPRLSIEDREKIVEKALDDEASPIFSNFLRLLLKKGRFAELPGIHAAFKELLEKRAGRLRCEVVLPAAPDDAILKEIAASVERQFGRPADITVRTDPGIVGGAIIRVGDHVLDASVRNQLKKLGSRLRGDRDSNGLATA